MFITFIVYGDSLRSEDFIPLCWFEIVISYIFDSLCISLWCRDIFSLSVSSSLITYVFEHCHCHVWNERYFQFIIYFEMCSCISFHGSATVMHPVATVYSPPHVESGRRRLYWGFLGVSCKAPSHQICMRQKLVVGNCQNILGYFVKSHRTSDLGIMPVSCCFMLEPHCLWSDSMYQALFAKDVTSADEIGSWPCHHHLLKRSEKKKWGTKMESAWNC